MTSPFELVLASRSPRRRSLLERLNLAFTVDPADIDETVLDDEDPATYVLRLARSKAETKAHPSRIVIAADTTVVLDGQIVGKPDDSAQANSMLEALSGRAHYVMSGVAVIGNDSLATDHCVTRVWVDEISPAQRRWYVESGEGADKAGAYALQGAGALFADRVEGSVSNVVGLPLGLLDSLFASLDLDLLDFSTVGAGG